MSKQLRFGVIGCGGISQLAHLPSINDNANSKLVAVSDIDLDKAKEAGEKFGAEHIYKDFEDLLDNPSVDAVTICTPVFLHRQMVVKAAESGKHILCEKPLARNLAEANNMIEAAERNGVKFGIMYQTRYTSSALFIKQQIDAGAIGKPLGFRARSAHAGPDVRMSVPGSDMAAWVFDPDKAGGGVLMDIGVHLLDFLYWILGPVDSVMAEVDTLTRTTQVEDHALLLMRLENGMLGEADLSWSQKAGHNYVEIFGTEGTIELNRSTGSVSIYRKHDDFEGWSTPTLESNPWYVWHKFVIGDFAQAVLDSKPLPVPASDGRETIRLIEAAYQSSREGQRISLDRPQQTQLKEGA